MKIKFTVKNINENNITLVNSLNEEVILSKKNFNNNLKVGQELFLSPKTSYNNNEGIQNTKELLNELLNTEN